MLRITVRWVDSHYNLCAFASLPFFTSAQFWYYYIVSAIQFLLKTCQVSNSFCRCENTLMVVSGNISNELTWKLALYMQSHNILRMTSLGPWEYRSTSRIMLRETVISGEFFKWVPFQFRFINWPFLECRGWVQMEIYTGGQMSWSFTIGCVHNFFFVFFLLRKIKPFCCWCQFGCFFRLANGSAAFNIFVKNPLLIPSDEIGNSNSSIAQGSNSSHLFTTLSL